MHKKKLTKLPFRQKRLIRLPMKPRLRRLLLMQSLPMLSQQWRLQLRLLTAWNQSKFKSLRHLDHHPKIVSKLLRLASFYSKMRRRIMLGITPQR